MYFACGRDVIVVTTRRIVVDGFKDGCRNPSHLHALLCCVSSLSHQEMEPISPRLASGWPCEFL